MLKWVFTIICSDVPESFLSSQSHKPFESESIHDLVESSHKKCGVTSSYWFASSSQCWVIWNFSVFLDFSFATKWRPTCYKMAPYKLQNGVQCCLNNFECRLFISKLFVKVVWILLVSFALSHFHKSSPTLLQEIYFLVFHMPNKWKWPETNMYRIYCKPWLISFFHHFMRLIIIKGGLHFLFLYLIETHRPGVANLGYMYPWGYICLSKGVYLRIAIERENIFIYYLFRIAHISVNIIFKKHFILLVKSII